MNLSEYFGKNADFIIGAYAIAVLIVAALIVWVIADHWRQRQRLSDLEARGITRRSERNTEKQP